MHKQKTHLYVHTHPQQAAHQCLRTPATTHPEVTVSTLYSDPALIVGVRGRFAGLLLSPAELPRQESTRTLLSSVQRLA